MTLVCNLILLYIWVLIARIVLEWIQVPGEHPVGRLREALALITDPVLEPTRRLVPPVSMGSMGLDLSPLIVIVALGLVRGALC